jgi:uncharacterized protein YegL
VVEMGDIPYLNILQSLTVGPKSPKHTLCLDIKILPKSEIVAQPFYGVWLLDTSLSMADIRKVIQILSLATGRNLQLPDGVTPCDKFKAAISSLKDQVNTLPDGTVFSLIGFGPVEIIFENKVIDKASKYEILKKLDQLEPVGDTPMYAVLEKAIQLVKSYKGNLKTKKIILITDGYPSDYECSETDPSETNFQRFMVKAKEALEYKTSIDTIAAIDKHNVLLLYEMAKQSTGKYIFAKDTEELTQKVAVASQQATLIIHSNPALTIKPLVGKCTLHDAIQYKPTIIRMPFEKIKEESKAFFRSLEAGDTYQIVLKMDYEFTNVNALPSDTPVPILNLYFDFGDGNFINHEIKVKFSDDPSQFKLNQNINKTYIQYMANAKEISEATLKGDPEATQKLQGDETKKIN